MTTPEVDTHAIMRRSAIAVILLVGGWFFFGDNDLVDGLALPLRVVGFLVMAGACSAAALHVLGRYKP